MNSIQLKEVVWKSPNRKWSGSGTGSAVGSNILLLHDTPRSASKDVDPAELLKHPVDALSKLVAPRLDPRFTEAYLLPSQKRYLCYFSQCLMLLEHKHNSSCSSGFAPSMSDSVHSNMLLETGLAAVESTSTVAPSLSENSSGAGTETGSVLPSLPVISAPSKVNCASTCSSSSLPQQPAALEEPLPVRIAEPCRLADENFVK